MNLIYTLFIIGIVTIVIYKYYNRNQLDGFKDKCEQPKGTDFTHWSSKWWNPSLKKVPYEDMSPLGSMGTF